MKRLVSLSKKFGEKGIASDVIPAFLNGLKLKAEGKDKEIEKLEEKIDLLVKKLFNEGRGS